MEAVPTPPPQAVGVDLVELLERQRNEALQQLQRARYENSQLRENEALIIGMLSGAALAAAAYLWFTLGDHVDVEDLVLHVRFSHGRKVTKNGRWRTLPICSELAPILLEWLEPRLIGRDRPVDSPSGDRAGEVLLFPGQSAGGRMGVDCAISKRLRFALEGLGIEKGSIRFHDLRHSFATLADEAGIAEEVVSKVLGHSPSITGRYTHRTIARLRQELERLKLQQP